MKVLPIERIVVLFGAFAASLYYLLELPSRARFDFYLKHTITSIDNYALLLCIAAIIYLLRGALRSGAPLFARLRSQWELFCRHYFKGAALLLDFRQMLGVLLTLAIFTHLKHLIPLINSNVYDGQLADFERAIFGGEIVSWWMIQIFGPSSAAFMSWSYIAYYTYMNSVYTIFVVQRDRALASEFCTAFALLWLLGILVVYAYPTWGPCFYLPQVFSELPRTPVSVLQEQLWQQAQQLALNPKSKEGIFLISGLPSLHIAVILLGSVYLTRLWRPIGYLSWAFVVLTWVSTLYLGWHYLLDNLVAVILVWLVIFCSRRIHKEGC